MGQGIGQILVYAAVLIALSYPLGIWMARVYTREKGRRRRARLPPPARARCGGRPGLEAVRALGDRLHDRLQHLPLRAAAPAGAPLPQPRPSLGRAVGCRAEHDRELRHQHELAVLRRRGDDVVPQPDGRAGGAAVRLGRGRAGGARSGGARRCAPRGRRRARQLLARPLPLDRLHPAAALDRARDRPDLAGRAADVPRTRHGDDAPGRASDDRARPRRLDDLDQAARDERRRLLRLELGRSVREPDAALELPRDAGDPADPVCAGRDVRAHGLCATARVGAVRRVLRDLLDRCRGRLPR